MTDTHRHLQSHDERGNLIGDVALADGTIESVDALDAWAEAFESADDPRPLTSPRRGRPSLATEEGESPRVTVRLPRALLAETDAAAKILGGNRADLVRLALEQYLHTSKTPATLTPRTDVRGAKLTGSNGDNLGKVEGVYLDTDTSKPEWAEVKTGFFGAHVSLVPMAAADWDGRELTVPFGKDMVKDGPHNDPGHEISTDEERELFAYYGIPYNEPSPRPGGRRLRKYVSHGRPSSPPPPPPPPISGTPDTTKLAAS